MPWSIAVATLLLAYPLTVFGDVLNLASLDWTLKNQNGTIAIPAKIPSQAHLDLLREGIITEPLLGINGAYASVFVLQSTNVHLPRLHATLDCRRKLDVYCGTNSVDREAWRRSPSELRGEDIARLLWPRYRRQHREFSLACVRVAVLTPSSRRLLGTQLPGSTINSDSMSMT